MARNPETVRDLAEVVGLQVWDSFLERACCDKKEVFLNGGWRGGKSASAAFVVFISIVLDLLPREGKHLVWLVGPDYSQARQEFFYLMDWSQRLGLSVADAGTPMQGPMHVTLGAPGMPGTVEVGTKQAGDPTSLGSVAPVIILACEAGQFSEEAMLWLVGRTAEKNATLIWSGTFENEDGKAQFAWFEEESEKAWTAPHSRQRAFRLPTWENMSIYSSCSEMIKEDASLGIWCPSDTPHGFTHSGLQHPMIRKLADQWKDRPKDWRKRFGGEPVGVTDPVYEWTHTDSWEDHSKNTYLISMSAYQQRLGIPFRWSRTYGGIDPGRVHPAACTVLSTNQFGDIWVRRSTRDKTGNSDSMWALKKSLEQQFHIKTWGGDPVGMHYEKSTDNILPMTGSLWRREERVKVVHGYVYASDGQQHLFFDADDPGVVLLFREMQHIHRRRKSNGDMEYHRVDDDMTASFEDAIAALHSDAPLKVKRQLRLDRPAPAARPVTATSVS